MVGNNRSEIITTLAASEGAIGGTGWVFSSSRKPVSENCLTRSFLRGDWDGPWNGWPLKWMALGMDGPWDRPYAGRQPFGEIGRASCRERVTRCAVGG